MEESNSRPQRITTTTEVRVNEPLGRDWEAKDFLCFWLMFFALIGFIAFLVFRNSVSGDKVKISEHRRDEVLYGKKSQQGGAA